MKKLGSCSTSMVLGALGLNGLLLLACGGQQTVEPATPSADTAKPPAAAASAAPMNEEKPAPASEPSAVLPPVLLKDVGFATPESVLYDADADVYLVSNINGNVTAKDDNGFISRVAPDGTVQTLKWIDGAKESINLNAPKGMAIARGLLYVADIDFVRIFDAKTGKAAGKIGIPQATFLNDVAAGSDGTLYVTDSGLKVTDKGFEPSGTDAVYKIDTKGKAEALIKGESLNRPNGIFVDDSGVWVVSYGSNELFRVANGEKTSSVALPTGSLDGLVRLPDGGVLASSWDSSSVYYGKDGKFNAVVKDAKSPADIGYDSKRSTVLVPLFMENAVLLQKLDLPAQAPEAPSAVAPTSAVAPSEPTRAAK